MMEMGEQLGRATAVVDVRAPAEFAKGAIAGAVNIPLFSNGERAEVGTIYRQIGRKEAIAAGMEFVGGKLSEFVTAFEPFMEEELLIYCARGGMRSTAVVSLLSSLGYRVSQLPGGYKGYRNHLLRALEQKIPPELLVLHGRTGVGKTLLLARLPNALDLEGLARHRSSLFGAVGLSPRTQQYFESHLLKRLEELDFTRPVWVEGESRKVGDAILPASLRKGMQGATCILVEAPLELRIQRIIDEYSRDDPHTLGQLNEALMSLTPFFGKKRTGDLAAALGRGELEEVVRTLLVDYYDPRYLHGMRNYRYSLELSSEQLDTAVAALLEFQRDFISRAPGPPLASAR